ncbi:MAG: IclR family transcriptional regulator [Burkholderiales bacterium]|nr:IclR family transcriptional regulator [Burkholderiales bacterium]
MTRRSDHQALFAAGPRLTGPEQPAVKAVASALKVLQNFVTAQGPLGVSELAESTGLTKGQVSKILKTLRDFEFLEQNPTTQKYTVGLNAFALGNNYVNANELTRQALPGMRKLVDDTGHSAVLSIMRGTNVIHLMAVEGRLFVDGRWRVGRWMPYHSTAAGKLLLAHGEPELIETLLRTRGLPRITPNTITNEQQFRATLLRVKAAGFATSRSETHVGTGALAVPVYGRDSRAIATLGLICPEHLLTAAEENRLVPMLHRAARELSLRMGAEIYPFGA